MKKTAFIWRESIYKSQENGIMRCNKCKAKLFDYNTGLNYTNMVNPESINPLMQLAKDYMFCPDCGQPVGRIAELEVDDNDTEIMRGEWHERED